MTLRGIAGNGRTENCGRREKQTATITFVNNNCSNGKPLLYRYMKLGVVNIILLVSNRVHYISIIIHIMINMELNTQLARPAPSLLFGCIMYENILASRVS